MDHKMLVACISAACGGTILVTLFGKILWDWLSKKGDVPHAKNGFLTQGEIEMRCADQQRNCTKLIKAEFALIAQQIDTRLDKGDEAFKEIRSRQNGLEKNLKANTDAVNALEQTIRNGNAGAMLFPIAGKVGG